METLIIGTCGHIDHGKTSLVKALTGIETDRLKEEKERGITIELGFADMVLPSKRRVAFVDVPGHEKFVKNMISGVTGVNNILLIISADEGVMPQTVEHFEIIKALKIENLIVALTKCDKCDDEIIELACNDVRDLLEGSDFENAPIIKTSIKDGTGLKELKEHFERIFDIRTDEIILKEEFRMPIDRVFTIHGAGTVVTGTIINGEVVSSDVLTLYPSKKEVKVRAIQTYGEDSLKGTKGNRCAINLVGIEKDEIRRGDILNSEKELLPSYIIDCNIRFANEKLTIKRGQRVRFYHGTKEIMGRIYPLDDKDLKEGSKGYIQIRLEDKVTVKKFDSYYIRNFSPIYNIGGGDIIEPRAMKSKGNISLYREQLIQKEKGSLEDNILEILRKNEMEYEDNLRKILDVDEEMLKKEIERLYEENKIIIIGNCKKNIIISKEAFYIIKSRLLEVISKYHKKHPLDSGISKEELRKTLTKQILSKSEFNNLLDILNEDENIRFTDGKVHLKEFKKRLNLNQKNFKNDLMSKLEVGFVNLNLNELMNKYNLKLSEMNNILIYLKEENEIVQLNDDVLLKVSVFDEGLEKIRYHFKNNKTISLGECRDLLNTNRKIALAFLEELDCRNITKRTENNRVLL